MLKVRPPVASTVPWPLLKSLRVVQPPHSPTLAESLSLLSLSVRLWQHFSIPLLSLLSFSMHFAPLFFLRKRPLKETAWRPSMGQLSNIHGCWATPCCSRSLSGALSFTLSLSRRPIAVLYRTFSALPHLALLLPSMRDSSFKVSSILKSRSCHSLGWYSQHN